MLLASPVEGRKDCAGLGVELRDPRESLPTQLIL